MAAENESGWETPEKASTVELPSDLPEIGTVDVKYDGEIFTIRKGTHKGRRFRFVASHWSEVKNRAPRTPKSKPAEGNGTTNATADASAPVTENAATQS